MKPCISTTICLLDAPNTDCQYVVSVVGFAHRHDLMWEAILILNFIKIQLQKPVARSLVALVVFSLQVRTTEERLVI